MTPEQFCYWLQGKLEGRDPIPLSLSEVKAIQDHLETVFHKVTPVSWPAPNDFEPPFSGPYWTHGTARLIC